MVDTGDFSDRWERRQEGVPGNLMKGEEGENTEG